MTGAIACRNNGIPCEWFQIVNLPSTNWAKAAAGLSEAERQEEPRESDDSQLHPVRSPRAITCERHAQSPFHTIRTPPPPWPTNESTSVTKLALPSALLPVNWTALSLTILTGTVGLISRSSTAVMTA